MDASQQNCSCTQHKAKQSDQFPSNPQAKLTRVKLNIRFFDSYPPPPLANSSICPWCRFSAGLKSELNLFIDKVIYLVKINVTHSICTCWHATEELGYYILDVSDYEVNTMLFKGTLYTCGMKFIFVYNPEESLLLCTEESFTYNTYQNKLPNFIHWVIRGLNLFNLFCIRMTFVKAHV